MPYTVVSRPRPESVIAQSVGDVDHLYCCDPDLSLCGEDISAEPEVTVFTNLCPLCDVLDAYLCLRCGS